MNLYKLVIVGRANVGKSSLFNKICKQKISIVHEREGITRDRLYNIASFEDKPFIVIDTAGIELNNKLELIDEINIQTEIAIKEADVIVMVVDAKVGLTNMDQIIAKNILKTKKKIILAINKIDAKISKEKVFEFKSLGLKNIIEISCSQNYHVQELINLAFRDFSFDDDYKIQDVKKTKIAIIGRSNVGKSTLLNTLADEHRIIVSETYSTTRDSIDVDIIKNEKVYTFIDTAGIRRKNKEKDVIEKFSHSQTLKSIEKADICLLILDATDFITTQDKKILKIIQRMSKGCIILINKWDKIKNVRQEHFLKALNQKNDYFPKLIISAVKKLNVNKIFTLIDKVLENKKRTIKTHLLNKFIEKCIHKYHPPMIFGKRLKIYYLTQVKNNPPHFLFFVNYPNLFTDSYKKYLINNFRSSFDFEGIPIIFDIKKKPQNQT